MIVESSIIRYHIFLDNQQYEAKLHNFSQLHHRVKVIESDNRVEIALSYNLIFGFSVSITVL